MSDRSKVNTDRYRYGALVRQACETFTPGSTSPVYLALKRMVEEAAPASGVGRSKGYVNAHSEPQETVEVAIKKALTQRVDPIAGLPKAIDDANVEVYVCYAETVGVSGGRVLTRSLQGDSSDRLIQVWKWLSTHPDQVRIDAYCDSQAPSADPRSER